MVTSPGSASYLLWLVGNILKDECITVFEMNNSLHIFCVITPFNIAMLRDLQDRYVCKKTSPIASPLSKIKLSAHLFIFVE